MKSAFLRHCQLGLIFVLCAVYSWKPLVGDSDFWAHASIGRWICESAQIPRHSLFLWSGVEPWVAHSWGFEIVAYKIMAIGGESSGPYLALLFTALMVSGVFFLTWCWFGKTSNDIIVTWILLLAVQGTSIRFFPRPELFSALGLCLLLTWLNYWSPSRHLSSNKGSTNAADSPRPNSLWRYVILAVLFVCWTNCHAGVMFGLLLVLMTAVSDLFQQRFSREAQKHALSSIAASIAFLINPYGFQYVKAFTFSSGAPNPIEEFLPFWAVPALSPAIILSLGILVAIAVFAWTRSPSRRWAHLPWLFLMVAAFFMARRNAWMLALVCLAVMSSYRDVINGSRLWEEWNAARGKSSAPPVALIRRVTLGALLLSIWAACDFDTLLPPRPLATNGDLPQGQADFLAKNPVGAHVLNDYNSAPYFEWRFGKSMPLFIDNIVYPRHVWDDYIHLLLMDEQGRASLKSIGCVIGRKSQEGDGGFVPPLYIFLSQSPEWKLVYNGADGPIWMRLKPAKS